MYGQHSQKETSEMVTYVIFSAIVDEVSMGVVQVQIVTSLLVDRVALGDPDVAAVLPE